MKRYICIGLIMVLLLPITLALTDLYWWFWFDHKLSTVDWVGDSTARVIVAGVMAMLSMFPMMILSDENARGTR